MRVQRRAPWPARVEFVPGAQDARRVVGRRESLIVGLVDELGHRGVGEVAPLPGFSGESLSEVETALAALPASWDLDVSSGDPLLVAQAMLEPRLPPSLRFGLETALCDVMARRAGVSFEANLGGPVRARQITAFLVTDVADLEGLTIEAGRPLKIKVGRARDWRAEIAALRTLRDRVGYGTELRLDANAAWSSAQWCAVAPELAEIAPVWIEDPVAAEDWLELPPSPVPLAVDMPLAACGPELRERILEREDIAALVLKPTLLGGLGRARALSNWAYARGRPVTYSHAYEGPIGYSAIVAASLCDPAAKVAAGLAPHRALGPGSGQLERLDGAWLVPGSKHGLGFESDAELEVEVRSA